MSLNNDPFRKLVDPERFLYYGQGGGMYPMQQQATPQQEADARIAEARENARIAQETEERDRVRKQDELTQRRANNSSRLTGARGAAEQYGTSQLASRGLDPTKYGIMDNYKAAMDRAAVGFNPDAEVFTDPFSQSLFTDAYNTARSTEQRKLKNDWRGSYGDGFETSAFADTMDDAILDSILAQQETDARAALDSAYARGTINDYGKTYAAGELDRAKRAGRARAEDMGLGVIQGYRDQLTNEAKKTNQRIDDYDFGDDLNLDAARGNISGLQGRLGGRLEGDILNAIGGTQFFDTDTIIGKAGNRSGLVTPSSVGSPTASSFSMNNTNKTKEEEDKAKLGNTGAF